MNQSKCLPYATEALWLFVIQLYWNNSYLIQVVSYFPLIFGTRKSTSTEYLPQTSCFLVSSWTGWCLMSGSALCCCEPLTLGCGQPRWCFCFFLEWEWGICPGAWEKEGPTLCLHGNIGGFNILTLMENGLEFGWVLLLEEISYLRSWGILAAKV